MVSLVRLGLTLPTGINMTFFFHYNKPESRRQGRNVLTVHAKGVCHLVNHIKCDVPIETHARKTQPFCVIKGRATCVDIVKNKAYIY